MDYLETKELYHHGIKGQKWGVRRYQNEDGTWTREGLKRRQEIEGIRPVKPLNEKYAKRAEKIMAKYDRKIRNLEADRAADNAYWKANNDPLWDEDTGETMSQYGNRYYDERVKKLKAKQKLVLTANQIKNDMSKGDKFLRNILLGPFANEIEARWQAGNAIRNSAAMNRVSAMLSSNKGGLGSMPVSSLSSVTEDSSKKGK